MTEAELLESSVVYFGLSMDTLSFYMTVISTLYICMPTVTTYGLFSFMTRAPSCRFCITTWPKD